MPDAKVMIVTGAGSGIGYETALLAARDGFSIVAVSLEQPQLYELADTIVREGGACIVLPLDITARDAPQRIVQAARETYGRIDALVHIAGAASVGALLEQSDEQIDAQWRLHVLAPLRITREAMRLLKASAGHVMLVGSGLARVPSPYYGAYCAAKAAVRAMATQLRREVHRDGISVTYIDPGSVRTNFAKTAGIPTYDPDWTLVDPAHVARRIVRATHTRPHTLNAVPLHTLAITLGEWFPRMTDRALKSRMPPPSPPPSVETPTEAPPEPMPLPQPEPVEPKPEPERRQSAFERALEPVSRRMERVKLPAAFLAELLRPGDDVHLTDAAMRWAGMPNKNERAAMAEALDALAAGGFLEKTGDESWRVVRSAG